MKILVVIEQNPKQRFLVNLHTKKLATEVKNLINRKKYSNAIATVISKGRFEKNVECHELPNLKADLILSKDNVSWDIAK